MTFWHVVATVLVVIGVVALINVAVRRGYRSDMLAGAVLAIFAGGLIWALTP